MSAVVLVRNFAMLGLVAVTSLLSGSTEARTPMDPMLQIRGTYQLQNCDGDLWQVQKAFLRFRADKGGNNLQVFAFDLDSREELSFAMYQGQEPGQADGTRSWDYQMNWRDFVFTERFERRGSNTWPDLGYETVTTVALTDKGVSLKQETRRLWGHASARSWSCEMERLPTTWTAEPVDEANQALALKDSPILKIANFPLDSKMDLDQAQVDQKLLTVSTTQLSREQIKEILLTEVLSYGPVLEGIEVRAVGPRSSPANTARRAMATALGIANGRINEDASVRPEYKSLFDMVDAMADFIANKPATMKIYLIEWNESDADGEGLLIIDETTQQIFYLGSSYFS
jgi:hypothetical protein